MLSLMAWAFVLSPSFFSSGFGMVAAGWEAALVVSVTVVSGGLTGISTGGFVGGSAGFSTMGVSGWVGGLAVDCSTGATGSSVSGFSLTGPACATTTGRVSEPGFVRHFFCFSPLKATSF